MKHGKPLARRTPLASVTPLGRGTGLARTARQRKPARDTGPSPKVRRLVHAREGFCCASCGIAVTGIPHSLQHRVARGMGGTSRPEINALPNLVLLCGSATSPGCHRRAEDRDPGMRERGFWLRSHEDPAVVPVTLWDGRRVLLGADGSYVPVIEEEAA